MKKKLKLVIIPIYSEIHTKQIRALCGQNDESCNVKPGGVFDVAARMSHAIGEVCWRCCDSPHGSIPGEVPSWMMQPRSLSVRQRIAKLPRLIRDLHTRSVNSRCVAVVELRRVSEVERA
jgi:hypothetical protein